MTANALHMSGLFSLAENQTQLLESLGLSVPATMTAQQLTTLLADARVAAQQDRHPVLGPIVDKILDDITALLTTR